MHKEEAGQDGATDLSTQTQIQPKYRWPCGLTALCLQIPKLSQHTSFLSSNHALTFTLYPYNVLLSHLRTSSPESSVVFMAAYEEEYKYSMGPGACLTITHGNCLLQGMLSYSSDALSVLLWWNPTKLQIIIIPPPSK